jgi:hypothetical protein
MGLSDFGEYIEITTIGDKNKRYLLANGEIVEVEW